ncbi:MAG TPA: MBL fold metallo-hydrolase [Candidatus Acidoferrales bacterium]|nr:MBL fold metallo-hydrolase [Candidatus Acidoferrales bacterium]
MAQIDERLPQNVEGEFYVDASCIDCDACRQIAPASFREYGSKSIVYRQPHNPGELHRALMALVACPTASIGTVSHRSARPGVAAFPMHVVDEVYYCGFNSEASFGAWSYLIVRPKEQGGNVLVDSPRFNAPLVKRIEQMGGVSLMFLSHRDDIADHAKFSGHFRMPRIMHQADGAAARGIERVISGNDPVRIDDDLEIIPTPGHTRGHQVLLYRNKVLFTGDTLAWSPERETLTAFRDVCWYSWAEQTRSMEKLLDYPFEWVLPGHGRIGHGTAEEMHAHLERCVERMRQE